MEVSDKLLILQTYVKDCHKVVCKIVEWEIAAFLAALPPSYGAGLNGNWFVLVKKRLLEQ